jgi:hypothetical protein
MHARDFSKAGLSAVGFVGWIPIHQVLDRLDAPRTGGVYAVAMATAGPPTFSETSSGGRFKAKDPTVSNYVLVSNWVQDAEIIYIGKSGNLQRRLREFAKFGQGQPIGHWGGRLIWQISAPALVVGWKETPDNSPAFVEAEMLAAFIGIYGQRPFANLATPR